VSPALNKRGLIMDQKEATEKIVAGLQKKKSKTKFYFKELAKILDLKPREAKKLINKMIEEEVLEYWSSGSTSLYGLKGAGKQAAADGED
jgi:Mn-dependent DtxR family transcriptional regulator